MRRFVAANTEGIRAAEYELRYSRLRDHVEFISGIAVCRTFEFGELSSTHLDEIQDQYDRVCKFASELSVRLPGSPPAKLDPAWFSGRPHVTDPLLLDAYSELDEDLQQAVEAQTVLEGIVRAKEHTPREAYFSVIWPLFLVCALALRITKVSGELSLDS